MSFTDLLGVIASVAVAVERATEVLKPFYLKAKNKLFKKDFGECTKAEKNMITIILGTLICIIAEVGVDIPGVNEASIIQKILAGLIASFGSNVLHTILSILTGIKDTTEARAARKYCRKHYRMYENMPPS